MSITGCTAAKAIFWGNCIGHFKLAKEGSLANRTKHVAMGILEAPPGIGQIFSSVEYSCIGSISSIASSTKIMREFWQNQINAFEIRHGTNGLYLNHFKRFGISATYPAALEDLIAKIRNVWTNHQQDIERKSGYFLEFERRYDEGRKTKNIAFSFSANEFVTREFTTGARQGGEWIRELRRFIREAKNHEHLLSLEERKTILEMISFIQVLDSLPPLIVKVHAGCPELRRNYQNYGSLFYTWEDFIAHVKHHCAQWQDPVQLSKYLETVFLPQLERVQEAASKNYEISIVHPIAPEHLEFECVRTRSPISKSSIYPRLSLDKPTPLRSYEIVQLHIDENGFSDREEYHDSRFAVEYRDLQTIVTRKKLREEDLPLLAQKNELRAMRIKWLQAFQCTLISPEDI